MLKVEWTVAMRSLSVLIDKLKINADFTGMNCAKTFTVNYESLNFVKESLLECYDQ